MVALDVLLDIGDELIVCLPANCHAAGAIYCLSHDPPFGRARVYAPVPPGHRGRRLRPGAAGLSRRRTDAGADAMRPCPHGRDERLPHPPLECAGSARARSARERRNKIRAKAQLSLGDYAADTSTPSFSRAPLAASCSAAFFDSPEPTPSCSPSIIAAQVNRRSCGGPSTSSTA